MDEQDAQTFEKHSDELIRFATVLVGAGAAEDVLVDAALRAFSTPGWKAVAEPKAYLYRRSSTRPGRPSGRAGGGSAVRPSPGRRTPVSTSRARSGPRSSRPCGTSVPGSGP